MARPTTLNYGEIKQGLIDKGFDITEVKRDKNALKIFFNCSECGESYSISYGNHKDGDNPNFLCKKCQLKHGPKMQRIQEYFDSVGVPIESTDFFDDTGHSLKHWIIHFNCSRCGKPWTILDDYVGKNNKELCCENCRDNAKIPTQEEIKKFFTDRGSELLSEYKGLHKPLTFKCSSCGVPVERTMLRIRGNNPELLCLDCIGRSVKREFYKVLEEHGTEALEEFQTRDTPVYVRCTRCGEPFKFRYSSYKDGYIRDIKCPACSKGILDPSKTLEGSGRSVLDPNWSRYVKEFFNIPKQDWGLYNSHHIIRYVADRDYSLSIGNGYPLLNELHKKNSYFYHSGDGSGSVSNWTGEEKLPYHDYPDFRFIDINSKVLIGILFPIEAMDLDTLYKNKIDYWHKGILYLPFFYTEMQSRVKREIVYSMVRSRLYKWFPDIYRYTGAEFKSYYARKLEICEVKYGEAKEFLNKSHIQGELKSSLYIGLKTKDGLLVSCMAFSKARYKGKDVCEYELTRFASLPNTSVVGGASKIFKYFVKTYDPESVVSFCDIRFSSLNSDDTVYKKLGFVCTGKTKANYGYRDPISGVVKNRRSFQKSKLEKILDFYDPNLTEAQNMELNGFVRQVDCGNFRFVWKRG